MWISFSTELVILDRSYNTTIWQYNFLGAILFKFLILKSNISEAKNFSWIGSLRICVEKYRFLNILFFLLWRRIFVNLSPSLPHFTRHPISESKIFNKSLQVVSLYGDVLIKFQHGNAAIVRPPLPSHFHLLHPSFGKILNENASIQKHFISYIFPIPASAHRTFIKNGA